MDRDQNEDKDEPKRGRTEGVRIIGAEEAARALEEGQAAGRRPQDAPRFGDVPARPSGPPAAQRFPLPGSVDPAKAVRRPPVATSGDAGQPPEMPHWTEAPSGEVPQILAGDDAGEEAARPASGGRGPRWRDQESDWAESDFEEMAGLAEDDEDRLGALDVNRTEHSDLFSFEEQAPAEEAAPADPEPVTRSIRSRRAAPSDFAPPSPPAQGRDVGTAVAVGVGFAVVALLLFKAGPTTAFLLALVVVTISAGEVYDVVRRAGYRPATLLGLTATVSLMIAAYNEGERAVPLVLVLTTVFSFLWYLFGVVRARPTINIAVTLFSFLWVGFLGSFAALLLAFPDRHGIAFLLGAVIATAAYDVGGLVCGSRMGRRPLAVEISPNKTVEGLVGGCLSSVVVSLLIVGVVPGIAPWTASSALALGLVVAVVAPLGDLCESMVKRDLGVKDMGNLLPGHGGLLDRFDGLLLVLPAVYYLVKLLNLG